MESSMKKEILLFSTDQITAMRDTGNIFRKVLLKRTQKYTLLVYVEENEKKKKKENGAGHYNCVQIHRALMRVEIILYNPNIGSLNHSWSCITYFMQ